MKPKNPPVLQYLFLAVLFAIACAYQIRATIFSFPDYFHVQAVTWPFVANYWNGLPHATFVNSAAQHAGALENDVILAINGRPFSGLAVFGETMRLSKPGEALTAQLLSRPDSAPRTISIPLERQTSSGLSWAFLSIISAKFAMPVFCILLGSWVVAVRPRDRSAWLLFLTLQFFVVYYGAGTESWGPLFRDLATAYRVALTTSWPIFMLLFGLYFPEPFPAKDAAFWKWAQRILVPPLALYALAAVIENIGEVENFASVASLTSALGHLSKIWLVLSFCSTGSFFACIATKSSLAITPDAKRRLRLLQWGTAISMAPACVLFITQGIRGVEAEKIFPEWFVLFALTLMFLFPITLAYTIVVHRALDVRVVIRQGLQYALATGGIRVLQVLLGSAVLWIAINLGINANRGRPQQITAIAIGIVIVLWLRKGADFLRKWTDRRFFRDAYNAEQVLASLGDEVRSIVETRPLLERVGTKIAESLHVPRIAFFLPQDGFYRPAYALGYDNIPDTEFPANAATIELLRMESEPTRVYFDDEKSWVNTVLPSDERQSLLSLDSQVLLPLSLKDKLLGLVSLGEKRSEAPYSGTDLRLLKSVAAQTALALSNAQLTSEIAVEVARREKLNREIEIAREVQERLFPQRLPEIAGLDYFGRCRTALAVGGDYYDFLALPAGKLGVALGDVSGKGIAAALTMASLQASLRAEAMHASDDIASLIARVNAAVYDASTEDRYATLFYAQFEPASRRLSYVNAGHCPPILMRKAASTPVVERLETGGTVVGLLPEYTYEQTDILLCPGDLLVIYTDGFSEAMNSEVVEWGERRLIEAVASCDGLCAKEAIERIMQAADSFAAGAPQSDDMTLVILRAL